MKFAKVLRLGFQLKGWIHARVGPIADVATERDKAAPLSLGANEKGDSMSLALKVVPWLMVASIAGTVALMVAPDLHGAFCTVAPK